MEITDADALGAAALEGIAAEFDEPGEGPAEERMHAESAVREDGAEALASLVDPFDLVGEVPGIELAQASWSSEIIDYDPEDPDDWDLDEGDDGSDAGEDDDDVRHTGEEERGGGPRA